MDSSIIFLFAAVLIIAALLFAAMGFTKKGGKNLNVEKYRSRWLAIEQSLHKESPDTAQLAIIKADKLVDQALRDRGVSGNTMGERMKSAKTMLTHADAVWSAHKLRNQIAHEADIHVSYDQARRALGGFKSALKDLGAI